ncbi:VOC family protein [Kineosporia mesophila]|uniref:VOC family protein n=1 Tax=Kineosporia mesophila TaxID=566012 RepID=A0ABP7A928_9ACTN|nr:VOC family protein [Kineosporia mesophila]MCD5354637.1 VOC family protein [Kineosporia mesophila]
MTNEWTITVDARHAPTLAAFWQIALGYVPSPPPAGLRSWEEWYERFDLTDDEKAGVAAIVDPEGRRPRISFLAVPETKTVKNRIHLDVQIGGGRAVEHAVRWPRVEAMVQRLTEAGARTQQIVEGPHGLPDHVVMLDPEGNEFCVL